MAVLKYRDSDGNVKTIPAFSGPTEYVKDASVSGNKLTLTDQDGDAVEFSADENVKANWNTNDSTSDSYIQNRTHWTESAGGTDAYDGTLTGKTYVEGSDPYYQWYGYVKVADEPYAETTSALIAMTGYLKSTTEGVTETVPITDQGQFEVVGSGAAVVISYKIIFVFADSWTYDEMTLTKGIWVLRVVTEAVGLTYISEISLSTETVHKLDSKYLNLSGGTGVTVSTSSGQAEIGLSSETQASLAKADTALQEHQSLSAYRTSANQDTIDSGKEAIGKITIGGTAYTATRKALVITDGSTTTTYYVADIT